MRPQPLLPAPASMRDGWIPPAVPEAVRAAVERSLGKILTSNEARVMRLRYGIGVQACRVSEIAQRLGVRVTTVLRLHARALRKLRASALEGDAPGTTLANAANPEATPQPIPARLRGPSRGGGGQPCNHT